MTPNNRYDYDQERIRREVVILDEDSSEERNNDDNSPWANYDRAEQLNREARAEESEIPFADEEGEEHHSESMSPWTMITTGRILPDNSRPYHRYFIAIAFMCFFSIFLTFMSLNANREYRQREKYASILHERAVLKEEEKYSLSSKQAVTARLKEHNIELIDLSKNSRLIEK
jgi:hypothetical protein